MSDRTKHRWLAWLLPLLVLRAFVPAGFMLSWTGNDLQMMLCSGTGPVSSQETLARIADSHAHHHQGDPASGQHQHDMGGGSQAHENSICPFAAAGSAGAPVTASSAVIVTLVSVERFDFLSDPELRSHPVSIDRIRGPPLS